MTKINKTITLNRSNVQDMYDKGYHDTTIAEREGVPIESIRTWRYRRGPPINRRSLKTEYKRMELYKQGLRDSEIARREGITRQAVFIWRQKHNLEGNHTNKAVTYKKE